jgi:subtilisin family serine protease
MERGWLSCVVLLALAIGCSARRCPLLHAADTANKTGCYIVVLNKETTHEKLTEILQNATNMAEGNKVYAYVEKISKAFTVKLSADALNQLREVPDINYIEEETMAEGAQSFLPYHLDRIDQRQLPLNGVYNPIGDGEGVDIYILDSGISYTHEEFGNRAKYSGYDPMDVYLRESRFGADCFGHGTHVASNAAGTKYGAAKKATLYSVRVLDCTNRGPWSTTLEGLDHVMQVIGQRGRPAIVSMSLSGGYQQSVNDAVQTLYGSGVPVVVAAGNGASDACSSTPASAPDVITVAGSANNDGLYFATNYGSCVDIFAPGDRVLGADYLCSDCSQFLSGTSFAAPIVSGAIALLLQRKPRLTPDEILSELTSLSVTNALDFRVIPSNFRASTPNRALFIPGSCGGEVSIGLQSNTTILSPNYPSNYIDNINCKWIISAPENTRVRISFSNFATESRYDTVELCSDQFCDTSTRLTTLSGQLGTSMRQYNSSSNVLSVELNTDGRVSSSGFRATVTAIEIQMPPTDPTATPSTATTTTPTTAATTAPPTVVTCPTVPPPQPTLNITSILQSTLTEAEILLSEVIGRTLNNLLQVKLDEFSNPTEPPTNTVTVSTTTEPSTQPTVTTQPTTPTPCRGCTESNPAFYCQEIANENSNAASGYYWIRGRFGVNQVYCDMTDRFMNTPGWMRVANLDMSDPNQDCPNGLGFISTPIRTCGRSSTSPGCSSTSFSTMGVSYSRVCGRVIGYQYSSPNAFFAHQFDTTITIDDYYVDGISLTHGDPREHIWSFAATLDENNRDRHICPCTHSSHSLPDSALPPFVGEDYFCDSGTATFAPGVFYTQDPLWDGQGCGPESSCCNFNTPPWFCKDLGDGTTDSVEMRICGNENTSNEDTPVEIVELYVQ